MCEQIKTELEDGNEGLTPMIDVTVDDNYEPILTKGSDGKYLATPVINVGGIVQNSTNVAIFRSEKTGLNQPVANNGNFNLLDLIGPTDVVINNKNLTFSGSGAGLNKIVKFPYVSENVSIHFKIRLTGTIAGGVGTQRDWIIEVRRPNNLVLESKIQGKYSTNTLNQESVYIDSFMLGADDPFILDGVKLFLNNVSGQTITITGIQFTVKLIY